MEILVHRIILLRNKTNHFNYMSDIYHTELTCGDALSKPGTKVTRGSVEKFIFIEQKRLTCFLGSK